ncbi:Pyrimidine dimer DNA glycosylase /DNA-(apurinic or apyrimidinic site) lyase [Oceanobacillus limi]|uniref:Pyrimidine dimer DNA glycosylase /DNA-(Apurinic or apyrimidinic site) lyase n=1 Tax=Oceanobacillus limi TaxID=930131 RepID=A0A1I0CDE8_9BACI|nr:TIGR02328 family protein [Oceanobacillus limi]SET17119.1 Pyrimidine dimer DNA glycosylase /DNA-(apurinic or apyrimidinic site) lyase [Oceanobacillus limi]
MRLWHELLLSKLPRQQLLGQHRECCALRGNGWRKPHATVNYVFNYSPYRLFLYHEKVMNEMEQRGYQVDQMWKIPSYRGKNCPPHDQDTLRLGDDRFPIQAPIYPEHDDTYYRECVDNLNAKGILLN